jgi:hypothetical protein
MTRLALMAQSQDQSNVFRNLVAVERDVSRLAIGNDQLAHRGFAKAPDERMPLQDFDAVKDDFDAFQCHLRRLVVRKIGETLEAGKGPPRIDYLRHARAFGRAACSPRARAVMYRWTSSAA